MRLSNRTVAKQKLVDLIPVANVILLLIFFFLLSCPFVLQPGLAVRLPTTSFETTSQQGRHIITLQPGMMFFDEKSINDSELQKLLKSAAEKSRGDWITINADESIPYGRVLQIAVNAMDHGFYVTTATQQSSPKNP